MAQSYFISPQYVKDNTIIDENLDEKYIKIAIQKAQKKRIIYMLGTGLYNEIAGQLPSSLTTLNQTLLDQYVAPVLLNATLVELLPFTWAKVSNRNVGTKDSEKTTSTNWADLDHMIKLFEQDYQLEAIKLRNYLLQNISSYPLWNNPGNGIDTIWPQPQRFDMGIYTGNKNLPVNRIDIIQNPGYYGESWKEV